MPLLAYANNQAKLADKKAFITIPGLGCGQFAGPFTGQLGSYLKDALVALLQKHANKLASVKVVYYNPYTECQNERREFDTLSLLVRPLRKQRGAILCWALLSRLVCCLLSTFLSPNPSL